MSTFKSLCAALVLGGCASAFAADFVLESPAIAPGGTLGPEQVFNGFGCSGKNISPALAWRGAPAGTKSYALTVYDPDAPTGSGWWHWVVVNIPAATHRLDTGVGQYGLKQLPSGAQQVRTDFGAPGFGGACPPVGDKPHRYVFTIYALKTDKLDLPPDASAAMAGFMIHANVLGQSSFTAQYGR